MSYENADFGSLPFCILCACSLALLGDDHNYEFPYFIISSILPCWIDINMMCIYVNFSMMLQTSCDGKLQVNMLKEVINECSEGKLLCHWCNIVCFLTEQKSTK